MEPWNVQLFQLILTRLHSGGSEVPGAGGPLSLEAEFLRGVLQQLADTGPQEAGTPLFLHLCFFTGTCWMETMLASHHWRGGPPKALRLASSLKESTSSEAFPKHVVQSQTPASLPRHPLIY